MIALKASLLILAIIGAYLVGYKLFVAQLGEGASQIVRKGGGFIAGLVALGVVGFVIKFVSPAFESAPEVTSANSAPPPAIIYQPPKPAHNYDFAERGEYGYSLAVSDLQRQAGQIAAQFVTYRYLGERGGRYQLYIRQGEVVTVLEATKPCTVIKTMTFIDADYLRDSVNVERVQCLPGTVGHLAFDDAMNDRLQASGEVMKDGSRRAMWMDERKGLARLKEKIAP